MINSLWKHAEWLSLIEISGPFLTVSMLEKAFPQGLEAVETPRRQKLRAAYEEWREAVDQQDSLLAELHREWIRLVLTEILEYDCESLIQAADWPGELPTVSSQEHAGLFRPDWIVRSPIDENVRLLIAVLPPDTDLESVPRGDGWPVSLQERMTLLCRVHNVRVGLLTDGERWMLVNAPVGSMSSQASWYARLWFQEPITLKAFQSLLGVRRCFGQAEGTLESLLDESLKHHEEVTDTLGAQVRRAVEVLVQCLDKADEDRNRELLRDVQPAELYEAGLTVMMRLVFVLCAEERGLLLLGDSVYDRCYAVSTLRGQLAEEADRHGAEVLNRRHDAWARLLAVFRAVYGGIEHESLRMPALGGSLFDPDRFPFLEGRAQGTLWRDTLAAPLPIDNRTVLLLLNSLQILEQSGGALLLSYRALDVEQIGHVYEGLLEHTVARVPRVTLGLQGSQKAKNPNVALAELESARMDSQAALVKLVLEITGRSESAIKNGLSKPADDSIFIRVLGVCGGDTALAERIRPFTNLLRTDAWDDPIVYRGNSFIVTLGADRRETGTHYTPKSLTESIVTTTLEPVVYIGPAEGKPREEWTLKSSREILDLKVCDPAMGSGAFLVQACRYLGEKLVEAWLQEEVAGKAITIDGEALDQLGAAEPLSSQLDERLSIARRLVAERCLYGVDVNPLAVELAKLSIWLITLAKGSPFGFLNHNLRSGDSLIGLHKLEQLTKFSLHPEKRKSFFLFASNIEATVKHALALRKQLREIPIRDIRDVQYMDRLDQQARQKLKHIQNIADAMIGEAFASGGKERALETAMDNLSTWAAAYIEGDSETGRKIIAIARKSLSLDLPAGKPPRKPFHWALEFPEVFERGGFDGVVGNPPFLGGLRITELLGETYNTFLSSNTESISKKADLCGYFFLRAPQLVRRDGCFGFIATNTISQGVTRKSSLEVIINNGSNIFHCAKSFEWPGKASVVTAVISASNGKWQGQRICDSQRCNYINSLLEASEADSIQPNRLSNNKGYCYQGSTMWGDEFFISKEVALDFLEDPANASVVKQVMGGKELNNSPLLQPDRWAINFGEMDEDEARKFSDVFRYVESLLKQKRSTLDPKKYARMVYEWWKYFHSRSDLYSSIGQQKLSRVLARSRVSDLHMVGFVDSSIIYTDLLVVFCFEGWEIFALLQSNIHDLWARTYASTMKSDVRYIVTDCFETFPFPENTNSLKFAGRKYYEYRESLMMETCLGLTKTYNRFHAQDQQSEEIQKLRSLQVEMDQTVVAVYGWDDLELGHDFYETKQGIRFTISEEARREVMGRLLKLNQERYEEEIARRPKDVKKKPKTLAPHKKKTSAVKDDVNMDLFHCLNAATKESK